MTVSNGVPKKAFFGAVIASKLKWVLRYVNLINVKKYKIKCNNLGYCCKKIMHDIKINILNRWVPIFLVLPQVLKLLSTPLAMGS